MTTVPRPDAPSSGGRSPLHASEDGDRRPGADRRPPADGHRHDLRTGLALVVALSSLVVLSYAFRACFSVLDTGHVALREGLMLGTGAGLLLFVRWGEELPLTSLGIGTSPLAKSLAWGLVTVVLFGCALAALRFVIGTSDAGAPPTRSAFDDLPLGLVVVIVLRAGIVEELFYRGYAIERLQTMGLARPLAATVSLAAFALGHVGGGLDGILVALAGGAVLTATYLWRRDLIANMIAHVLVDFAANLMHRL